MSGNLYLFWISLLSPFLFIVILLSTTLPKQEYKKSSTWMRVKIYSKISFAKEWKRNVRDVGGSSSSRIYIQFFCCWPPSSIYYIASLNEWRKRNITKAEKKFSHLLKLSLHLCHIVLTDFPLFPFHFLTLSSKYTFHSIFYTTSEMKKKIEWKSFSLKIMAKHFQFTSITIFHWSIAPSSECRKSAWFNRFFIILHEHQFWTRFFKTFDIEWVLCMSCRPWIIHIFRFFFHYTH